MDEQCIKVGAGIVIVKDGMTLLAKRSGTFSNGEWGSMGGNVEFGETPEAAAIREAKEELGIVVGNLRFMSCSDVRKEGKHYIDISFVGEIISGEPTIMEPDKIAEIGWFPLDNLPTPLFETVRIPLEALRTGQAYFETRA